MPRCFKVQITAFMIVAVCLLVGCVAHSADDLYRQKREDAKRRISPTSINGVKKNAYGDYQPDQSKNLSSGDDVDQQSIQRGKTLFHGKAVCFECHGQNGDIRNINNPKIAKLDPRPTDLRKPTDKSVRQLYLIIRYGIPSTAMVAIQELTKLTNEEVVNVISYILDLQGKPLPFEKISTQRFRPHTETDIAISEMCEVEAIGDTDHKDYCENRYSKRYRDLIIGRPPHISVERYKEIEARCNQQAAKNLDKLALCYRSEYLD